MGSGYAFQQKTCLRFWLAPNGSVPRMLRYQYPGAVYHLMARGDGGKVVFEDDEDRKGFLFRLAKVCASHGWRVHAWVLMGHWGQCCASSDKRLVSGSGLRQMDLCQESLRYQYPGAVYHLNVVRLRISTKDLSPVPGLRQMDLCQECCDTNIPVRSTT